jgi:valyl-tRNA synthetase
MLGVHSIAFTGEELPFPATVTSIGTVYADAEMAPTSGSKDDEILAKIAEIDGLIAVNESKLRDKNFIEKAPKNIVAGARAMLKDNTAKRDALKKMLKFPQKD